MDFSVVIPCYNEKENIPMLLDGFARALQGKEDWVEVILVDNGSTDGSGEVLDKLLPGYPFARTVRVEINQGYGYGILRGLQAAKDNYVGWTHADLQTDPADIPKACQLIKEGGEACYVKGKRIGRPWSDVFFTKGMGLFETIFLGCPLQDINAQPNFFPREFYESWENPPYDFSLDLYAYYMAQKKELKLCRFPVEFTRRLYGSSHWNTGLVSKWKFIKRTVDFSVRLKKGGIR